MSLSCAVSLQDLADSLRSSSPIYLLSDCGSPGWAFVLFITWNVLSMCAFSWDPLALPSSIDNFSPQTSSST